MSNNTNKSCHTCRQAGEKLFLKGERCFSPKCAFTRRSYSPGIHGPKSKQKRKSDYGIQLLEKQKAKNIFGLLERQFRNYYEKASGAENSGLELLKLLETRLDNVIKKSGFAVSIKSARQLVVHEHVIVNGRKVKSPNTQLMIGDKIKLAHKLPEEQLVKVEIPKWLKVSEGDQEIEVTALPNREEISQEINEDLIIELYSR